MHIGSSSITITDQHGHSNSVGLNDIAAVGVNRSSVEIEICNFPSSTRISIEFSSYSDATSACREIYAATPMSKEIKIDGNILRIGAPYGYGGKSIRMDEVKEARVDYNGMLEIQCIASYNSVSIRRKSTSAAKQEADMINEWLRKKEQTVEAEAKRNAVRQREREPKQQERREPERIPYVGQPRPKGQFKGTLKTVGLIVLALFAISFLRGLGNRTSSDSKSIDKECSYTDSLGNRYRYNISYTGDEPTVYSRTPNELINEWKNNVAKAEETYQKENVYIVTDGYIDSINKNESDDSYYIMLTEDPDEWSLFGSNEIRVSFHNEREYQALLDYNTGDHIVIICQSDDTTFFLEYPELEAIFVLNETTATLAKGIGNNIGSSKGSDIACPIAMIDYIGLTVADIEEWFGTNYCVDSQGGGGFWMLYSSEPGHPYAFLYCPAQGYDYSDTWPKADDIIYGVRCGEANVAVINNAKVGMMHDDFAAAIGQLYTAEIEPASDFNLPTALLAIRAKNANDTEENDYWLNLLEEDDEVIWAEIFKKID